MRRPSIIAAIALLIVLIASILPGAAAADGISGPLTVIAIDQGIAPSSQDLDAAETALGSIAPRVQGGGAGIISYGESVGEFQLLRAGPDTVLATQLAVAGLRRSIGPYKSDQFEALSVAYANLSRLDAPRGSRLIVVTPGRIAGESESTRSRLQSVGELFAREGWQVDVVSLPSTEGALREIWAGFAYSAGGAYYDLGATEGLTSLLRDWNGLRLSTVIDAELGKDTPSIAAVDVAPHTSSMSVVFLRSSSSTRVGLYRPNGEHVNLNAPGYQMTDLPMAVIYTIENPAAGTWRLEGSGSSKLVAGADVRNLLSLHLLSETPFEVGKEVVLKAAATIDGEHQVLPGAVITARVQQADGAAAVYQMNDNAAGVDATAGDGIFSALLPAPAKQGVNDVALELKWDGIGASIRSSGIYRTEVFPAIQVLPAPALNATRGDQVTVASVKVTVGQYPHLVNAADLRASLTGPQGEIPAVVAPKAVIEDGRAWEFDVRAALPATGKYDVTVSLASSYLGREFTSAGPAISALADVKSAPLTLLGLRVWAWAVLLVLGAAMAAAVVYIEKQARPFGYLYDDQDRVVVDFSKMGGSFAHRLIARSRVPARTIPGLPFQGGEFRFANGKIELHYEKQPGDPSIRVNSKPMTENVLTLDDDTWLGAGGRLLRFVTNRAPAIEGELVAAPAPADGGS